MNHYEILKQTRSIIVDKILLFLGIPAKIALWECCEQALLGYWGKTIAIGMHCLVSLCMVVSGMFFIESTSSPLRSVKLISILTHES